MKELCMQCGHTEAAHDGQGPWGGCSACTRQSGLVCFTYTTRATDPLYQYYKKVVDELFKDETVMVKGRKG